MKVFLKIAVLLSLLLGSVPFAFAQWAGSVAGKIQQFDVTAGGNFSFRVYLVNAPTMCAGGQNWAYLNESDSNYKTYLAALMMAKTLDSTVTIYTSNVGGFCNIGYVMVR